MRESTSPNPPARDQERVPFTCPPFNAELLESRRKKWGEELKKSLRLLSEAGVEKSGDVAQYMIDHLSTNKTLVELTRGLDAICFNVWDMAGYQGLFPKYFPEQFADPKEARELEIKILQGIIDSEPNLDV